MNKKLCHQQPQQRQRQRLSVPSSSVSLLILLFAQPLLSRASSNAIQENESVNCKKINDRINNAVPLSPSSPSSSTSLPPPPTSTTSTCGIWIAPSTIPNAGLGMYAGNVTFKKDDLLMEFGDPVIPIIDLYEHQRDNPRLKLANGEEFFILDDYTWDGDSVRMDHEALFDYNVNAISPGIGAGANCILDFVNVKESVPQKETFQNNMHRYTNASFGSFSYYQNRMSIARRPIHPGQEIFVNYGDHWFKSRPRLGPIPLTGDYKLAEKFYKSFVNLIVKKYKEGKMKYRQTTIVDDIWDLFIENSSWKNKSRILFTLVNEKEHLDTIRFEYRYYFTKWKRLQLRRDVEWLQEHGTCADHLKGGRSTLPNAGNGAFAKRPLQKDTVVAPVPLIHIIDKSLLEMYNLSNIYGKANANKTKVFHIETYQLLLNYAYGHAKSPILFIPYSPVVNLINHNQSLANVRLQWADPKRSQHDPSLLNQTLDYIHENVKSSRLAMELVALRDIEPHEEIFLDYGNSWEMAWQKHIENWVGNEKHRDYISAANMNQIYIYEQPNLPFRTKQEQIDNPYPSNLHIRYNLAFNTEEWENHVNDLQSFKLQKEASRYIPVEIIKRYSSSSYGDDDRGNNDNNKNTVIELYDLMAVQKNRTIIIGKPRASLIFEDNPYTTDLHINGAFRHEIHIPNDIFPEIWKTKGVQCRRRINNDIENNKQEEYQEVIVMEVKKEQKEGECPSIVSLV